MYRLAEVIAAIDPDGCEKRLNTTRMWFTRGWAEYLPDPQAAGFDAGAEADRPPPKAGIAGYLSRNGALQIALGCHFVDYGVHPVAALRAAAVFSHLSGAEAGYGGVPSIRRLPGGLYRDGRTILGVWRSETGPWDGWAGRCINAVHGDNYDMLVRKLTHGFAPPTKPLRVIILDCADVVQILKPLFDSPRATRAELEAKLAAKYAEADAMIDRLSRASKAEPTAARRRQRTEPVTS